MRDLKDILDINESLFDKDLTNQPVGYQLKDDVLFDGQIVTKLHKDYFLNAINWDVFYKEYKKLKSEEKTKDFDLGPYAFYSSKQYDRSKDILKKTDDIAKYILNVRLSNPLIISNSIMEYNSRLRDELEEKLNRFIKSDHRFVVTIRKHDADISLYSHELDKTICKLEFQQKLY